MRGRGYIRVSTDEQAKNGDSIPAQRKILEAYALIKGYDDFKIYVDDGYSGKNLNRPHIQELLAECRTGEVDAVIVWKLDRLSRSLRDTITIIEDVFQPNSVAFISATESIDTSTPSGRAMLSILATFAQFEREQDSERVSMVQKQLAQDCRYLGGPVPLGYRIVNKHYVIDETTAPIVRTLFEMYITRAGYTEMLHYLNDVCGLRTPNGKLFQKNSLNYILQNEKYIGIYVHNRLAAADANGKRSSSRLKPPADVVRIVGGIPAIIPQEVWDAACRIREENRIYSGRHNGRCRFILSGLCYCSECGSPLRVKVGGHDRNGTKQRYYVCRNQCIPSVRKEKIEAVVLDALGTLAVDEELLIRACEIANDFCLDENTTRNESAAVLEQRLEAIARRRANITDYISTSGRAAPPALIDELTSLDKERTHQLTELDRLRRPVRAYDPAKLLASLNQIRTTRTLHPEEQQRIIQSTVKRIIASQDDYKIILTGDCTVELRGVEPLSESSQAELSPSAVCGSKFPLAHAHRQE